MLWASVDTAWIDTRDPGNADLDAAALYRYLDSGQDPPEIPARLRLRWRGRTLPTGAVEQLEATDDPVATAALDVVAVSGHAGFLLSTRLRDILDRAAPGDLDCHPVTVNGSHFHLARVATVLDAVAARGTKLNYAPDGSYHSADRITWKAGALPRPAIFRIPQAPTRMWTTHHVAASYLATGLPGLLVAGPQGRLSTYSLE